MSISANIETKVRAKELTFKIYFNFTFVTGRQDQHFYPPSVLCKRTKHHRGSIYCTSWSADGELIATGSNDKTIKYMRFNKDTNQLVGQEVELNMHDGTVRDMCFLDNSSTKSRLLASGGAGDCKIYVTDCVTSMPMHAFSGHSGHISSLYSWNNTMFVSGSQVINRLLSHTRKIN